MEEKEKVKIGCECRDPIIEIERVKEDLIKIICCRCREDMEYEDKRKRYICKKGCFDIIIIYDKSKREIRGTCNECGENLKNIEKILDIIKCKKYIEILKKRYRNIRLFEKGGMGYVFNGEDKEGKKIIIKIPDDRNIEIKERIKREAQILEKLNRGNVRNIPKFYEFFYDNEIKNYCYVMEYIEGEKLEERIKRIERDKRYYYEEVLKDMIKVSKAVKEIHRNKIVHRDLHPKNIIFKEEGEKEEVIIIDYGLAKDLEGDTTIDKEIKTREEMILGRKIYRPPEQRWIKDDYKVKYESDIYTLGVVLYEYLIGELPYKEEHKSNYIPYVSLKNKYCIESLDKIIENTINPKIEKRYKKVEYLIEDLEKVLEDTLEYKLSLKNKIYKIWKFNKIKFFIYLGIIIIFIYFLFYNIINYYNFMKEYNKRKKEVNIIEKKINKILKKDFEKLIQINYNKKELLLNLLELTISKISYYFLYYSSKCNLLKKDKIEELIIELIIEKNNREELIEELIEELNIFTYTEISVYYDNKEIIKKLIKKIKKLKKTYPIFYWIFITHIENKIIKLYKNYCKKFKDPDNKI